MRFLTEAKTLFVLATLVIGGYCDRFQDTSKVLTTRSGVYRQVVLVVNFFFFLMKLYSFALLLLYVT